MEKRWLKYQSWAWLLAWLACTAACTHPHAHPTELPLLPEAATEKYYLLNQVSTDSQGHHQHDCALLTQSPTGQGFASALFVSRWSDRDSVYQFGLQAKPDAVWSRPGRWPLMMRMQGDSTRADWRVFFNRKSFWMDAQLQNASPAALRGTFPHEDSLAILEVQPNPAIYAAYVPPGRMREGQNKSVDVQLQVAVFCDAGGLLQDPANHAIYWIQIALGNGAQRGIFLILDAQRQVRRATDFSFNPQNGWQKLGNANGEPFEGNAHLTMGDPWTSPHSGKQYLLGLRFQANYESYQVRAPAAAQEVKAGKRSFWMGAVEFTVHENEELQGVGNMYVFQH